MSDGVLYSHMLRATLSVFAVGKEGRGGSSGLASASRAGCARWMGSGDACCLSGVGVTTGCLVDVVRNPSSMFGSSGSRSVSIVLLIDDMNSANTPFDPIRFPILSAGGPHKIPLIEIKRSQDDSVRCAHGPYVLPVSGSWRWRKDGQKQNLCALTPRFVNGGYLARGSLCTKDG